MSYKVTFTINVPDSDEVVGTASAIFWAQQKVAN